MFDKQHTGPVIAQNNNIRVINCKICNYAHLEQLPTQEELDKYYQENEFYNLISGGRKWFEKQKLEHEQGFWNTQYSYESKHLYGKVLDYGCGDGYFIRHYGNAVGVEPSSLAREYCNGLEVYPDLESLPQNQKYDSLRLSLVLEHILEPYQLIYNIKEYMKVDHRIRLVIPNEFNPLQNIIRKRLINDWFVGQAHINYFTKQSAIQLLHKCGYYIIDTSATFPMELFYLIGYKYIGNDKIGDKVHQIRLNFEKRFGINAYKLYRLLYNKLGWGREGIISAEYLVSLPNGFMGIKSL